MHQVEAHVLAHAEHAGAGPEDGPDEEHGGELIDPDERRTEEIATRDPQEDRDEDRGDQQGRSCTRGGGRGPAHHRTAIASSISLRSHAFAASAPAYTLSALARNGARSG